MYVLDARKPTQPVATLQCPDRARPVRDLHWQSSHRSSGASKRSTATTMSNAGAPPLPSPSPSPVGGGGGPTHAAAAAAAAGQAPLARQVPPVAAAAGGARAAALPTAGEHTSALRIARSALAREVPRAAGECGLRPFSPHPRPFLACAGAAGAGPTGASLSNWLPSHPPTAAAAATQPQPQQQQAAAGDGGAAASGSVAVVAIGSPPRATPGLKLWGGADVAGPGAGAEGGGEAGLAARGAAAGGADRPPVSPLRCVRRGVAPSRSAGAHAAAQRLTCGAFAPGLAPLCRAVGAGAAASPRGALLTESTFRAYMDDAVAQVREDVRALHIDLVRQFHIQNVRVGAGRDCQQLPAAPLRSAALHLRRTPSKAVCVRPPPPWHR